MGESGLYQLPAKKPLLERGATGSNPVLPARFGALMPQKLTAKEKAESKIFLKDVSTIIETLETMPDKLRHPDMKEMWVEQMEDKIKELKTAKAQILVEMGMI